MKIFITGAEGFIGSHLTEKLVKLGHYVKALVLYNSFNSCGWLEDLNKKKYKNLDIIYGDVRDENFIYNQTKKIDAIFHLAALISIPHSYNSYHSFVDTNINGTINILSSAKRNKIKKIFITSTSEVYGTAQKIPINEKHPLNPQSPYAATKVAADQISLSFFKSYGLPVTILRPFNTYGPRQSARAIIPTVLSQVLSKKKKIKLGNLSTSRDFTYIDDTINAFVKALNSKNIQGRTINISSNNRIFIKDLLARIKKITNSKFQIIHDKKRFRPKKSEVEVLVGNNKLANKYLKWAPKFASSKNFNLGLKKTIDWLKKPQNLSKYKSDNYNI
tara:strand:- start:2285 stop:3280 length:996 start_codon:yes stop_codon:yes gene_type:complete